MRNTDPKRPVIFGEVLFDVFPDQAIPGGAPFNVACHLKGFGLEPLMITRVGKDPRGEQIAGIMEKRSMDLSGLQFDGHHPTGEVRISMNGKDHSFEILPEQAYDFIDSGEAVSACTKAGNAGLLYHGSLAARNKTSRDALEAIRETRAAPVFVDINLREPWWSLEHCQRLMQGANWVKLNGDEFHLLNPGRDLNEADTVRKERDWKALIVTKDKDGALIYHDGEPLCAVPEPVSDFVDSVGAGDAFTSVIIFGLLQGWDYRTTLECAVAFAAEICRHKGATVEGRAVYDRFLSSWSGAKAPRG